MLIYVFSKWSTGGLSTFFQQLNKIKNKKINLYFFLYHPPEDNYKYFNINYRVIYPFFRYRNDSIFLWPIKFLFLLKDIIITLSVLMKTKNHKPLILCTDLYSLFILAILKKAYYKKLKLFFMVAVNLRDYLETRSFVFKKIVYFLTLFSLKEVDCIICVSKKLKINTISFFKLNNKKNKIDIRTIYHGIKLNRNKKIIRKYPKNNPIILYVGRLDEQKDVKTLLISFSILIKKIKTASLWIVGDGPDRIKLESLAKNLGLQEKIYFFGWQKNVKKFYQKADIFVLPSKYEGFGYVIIEAMWYGIPIIATKASFGPKEILKDSKYGILVPVGNHKKIAEAIKKLIVNEKLYNYYSKSSIKRALFFSEKKMLKKFKNLFTKYSLQI